MTDALFSFEKGIAMIISHEHKAYLSKWNKLGAGRWNGAYYYSKEIVENIIPNIKTDRNWITVNLNGIGVEHSIVFIHNNKNPQNYEWLKQYKDLVLVCGVPDTVEKVKHLGKAIYLPLSIDTEYVKQFKKDKKKKGTAYFGRRSKATNLPEGTQIISGLPREELLKRMNDFENIYAVGRCALEGSCLGANILPYSEEYPNPKLWKVLDNSDAVKILQKELDKIDKPKKETKKTTKKKTSSKKTKKSDKDA